MFSLHSEYFIPGEVSPYKGADVILLRRSSGPWDFRRVTRCRYEGTHRLSLSRHGGDVSLFTKRKETPKESEALFFEGNRLKRDSGLTVYFRA